jgi:hypothetical protein
VFLRCTSRVTQTLKLGRLADAPQGRDDWYVNIVTIARRRVVLAVHADTYFPVVAVGVSVSELRDLPGWLARQVLAALADEGLPASRLGSLDVDHALLVRTASKKVLGQLAQLALEVEHLVSLSGCWDNLDILELNRSMRRTLRGRDGGYVVPLELAEQRVVDPAADALLAEFTTRLHGTSPEELRETTGALLAFAGAVGSTDPVAAGEVSTLQLSASIDDAVPPIIRTLEAPVTLTLEQLHHVLQCAFGWQDSHLYRFAMGDSPWHGELYLCDFDVAEADMDGPSGVPMRTVRLGSVLDQVGDRLLYLYDYGDNWQVTLTLDAWSEGPRNRVAITGGAGMGPPDDCGGIHAWNEQRSDGRDFVVGMRTLGVRSLKRSPVR